VSAIADRLNSCAQSALSPSSWLSFGASAAVECINSAEQIAIAVKQATLKKRSDDVAIEIARAGFAGRVSQIAQSLQSAELALLEAASRTNASLSTVDGLRKEARVNIAKAVYLASYQSEKQLEYNRALGALGGWRSSSDAIP